MRVPESQSRVNSQEFKVNGKTYDLFDAPHKTALMLATEAKFNMPIPVLLWSLYTQQKKNMQEVGDYLGVSESTVRMWLLQFNIPLRTVSQARKLTDLTHHAEVMRGIQDRRREAAFGGDLRESLIRMHHTEGLTPHDIAKQTGYNYTVVVTYMTENGVRNMTPPAGWIEKHKELGNLLPHLWSDPTHMSCLGEREQRVLTRRHLSGDAPTLEEIAYELGITKEAVHAIEKRAIGKIQDAIKK